MTKNTRLADWLWLLLCNSIWGSQFVIYKTIQAQSGPIFTVFLPMTVAALLLSFFVHRQNRKNDEPRDYGHLLRKDGGRFLLLGIFGQALSKPSVALGMHFTLASNAALVIMTLPIVTAVIAYIILGERMTRLRWLSFALAIVGVIATSGVRLRGLNLGSNHFLLGNLMIFGAVVGSAFYNTYSKKLLCSYSPIEVLLYSYYAALIFMLPWVFILEPHSLALAAHFTPRIWLAMTFLAIVDYAVVMVIFLAVLSRLDAIQVGLSTYLMPLFGVLVAAVVLDEHINEYMISGGLLILSGTLLITIYDTPRDQAKLTV